MQNHSASTIVPLLGLICSYLIVMGPMIWAWWPRRGLEQPGVASGPQISGPTEAPACPACKAEQAREEQKPPDPPPYIEQKRGRPRKVDTNSHYCPNQDCRYYGWVGRGNLSANGHPSSGYWRQLYCSVCGKHFLETEGTIFYGKRIPPEKIWQVIKALAEGLGIRATARVFEMAPNTVEAWLRQASKHMETVSRYLIHNLHLDQVQVDELWALLSKRDVDEDSQEKKRAKRWVWVGTDPVSKLWLATVIGDRSQACAQMLVHAITLLLVSGCLPLFTSDQWSAYGIALLTHFGHFVPVPRRHRLGRPPKPRWQPLPGLLYGQVVKQRNNGRVVDVTFRVVYGSLKAIETVMANTGVGKVINTAFIERLNLSIRQHVAALARKVITLAKTEMGLRDQLSLSQAYHNFCLPHTSLRLPLPDPIPTKGSGSPKKWQQRTPAMAAEIADHIWRMEELLLFRVPPWQQDVPAAS